MLLQRALVSLRPLFYLVSRSLSRWSSQYSSFCSLRTLILRGQ